MNADTKFFAFGCLAVLAIALLSLALWTGVVWLVSAAFGLGLDALQIVVIATLATFISAAITRN